jgi:hypothetical protein
MILSMIPDSLMTHAFCNDGVELSTPGSLERYLSWKYPCIILLVHGSDIGDGREKHD